MSWTLLKPEKSEDEDSDFYLESTDEEDNRLRQECDMNRARIQGNNFEYQETKSMGLFQPFLANFVNLS